MKKEVKNIFCSISAGYSSVMMAAIIREWYPDHNIVFAMANTSKERIESLEFMNECDKYFAFNMSWIETIFNPRGEGVAYRVVDYSELKTNGEIFEEGIKKLGIPCKINKWCNRDMKINPLKKFADDVFGVDNYSIAVGLRADEFDRIKKDYKTNNTFYPLMERNITTRERNKFWANQPIQIKIPAFKGNCDMCFEKSNRKLMTTIIEEPDKAIWWDEMEKKYSTIPIDEKPAYNSYAENGGMNFYRDNLSIQDLIKLSKKPFRKATDEYIYENNLFDIEDECGSGCQVF
jgi:hypothetical protein